MELRVHDIVKIAPCAWPDALPEWVREALVRAPYAVVRRARATSGCVHVGVRGHRRNQRFPLIVPIAAVELSVSPESLVEQVGSRLLRTRNADCFRAVAQFGEFATQHSLCWGPVGSVGFELATGSQTTTFSSDLDLIVRVHNELCYSKLQLLLEQARGLGIATDVLLEGESGAVDLAEYVMSPRRTLIRTLDGPKLGIFHG